LYGDAALFVVVLPGGRLALADGRPFRVAGLDAPQLLGWAARPATRHLARELLSSAAALGLNTVRFFAFADGAGRPGALQVAPGVLDGQALREGLDWVVAAARRRRLRLIPVLTDGSSARHGGMAQYVRWINASDTVTDFLTQDTYKARFFDYMTALAVRRNAFTGMQYRHDPTILAWDLANRPRDPGHIHSENLQKWLPYMANFLRGMDPNHLIICGLDGFFGPHSPHHLPYNPPSYLHAPSGGPKPGVFGPDWAEAGSGAQAGGAGSAGGPWWGGSGSALGADPWDPLCEGTDFLRN
ncbi:Mannan endo-1,4-beta-mannosidase 6, partial [Tetrabaena socialis]